MRRIVTYSLEDTEGKREKEGNKEASFVLQHYYPARNSHSAVKVSKLKNTARSTNWRIITDNNFVKSKKVTKQVIDGKIATVKALKQVSLPSSEEMWVWKIWEKCWDSI